MIEPASGGRYEHRVTPGSYVLGREEASCDIAILSPEVSRQHARIHLSAEQCTVEDLGSTAGTSKDGQALEGKQSFPFPAEVMLGTIRLTISTSETLEMTFDSAAQGAATMKPGTGIVFAQGAPTASVPQAEAGHYTKGREIARGGMGAILEANDRMLGRTVAMKVVLEERASEDARMRFIREATVLGQLEHPNIIPIHELGKDENSNLFYTMKMVEGRTLQAIINDLKKGDAETIANYSLDGLLTVFRKVCDAIAFAHSKGIVHRDLKPENIMVGAFGEVLVMDWGLAKILSDAAQTADELGQQQLLSNTNADGTESALPTGFQELTDSQMRGSSEDLTMDGAVMGSPQYMPPEQAEGRIAEIDERSDVYSLGGILYAILTLQPPIQGKTVAQVLLNVKSGNITPPSQHNPEGPAQAKGKPVGEVRADLTLPHCPGNRVPGALSSVCMKALSMESGDRYANTRNLAADIEAFQTGRATSAEEITFIGQFVLLLKRNPQVSATIGLAALMITILVTGSLVLLNNSKLEAEGERDLATRATGELEKKEKKTREALARSKISLAEAAVTSSNLRLASSTLAEVAEEYRNADWHYVLNQISLPKPTPIHGRLDPKIVAAFPHPQRPSIFVIWDAKGALSLINANTGEHVFEFPQVMFPPGYETGWPTRKRLAITEDGRRLAAGQAGMISIIDMESGEILGEWKGNADHAFNWSSDGRLLSTQWGILDVTSGKEIWVAATAEQRKEWSYGGRGVFFLSDPKKLLEISHGWSLIRDPLTGRVLKRLPWGRNPLEEVIISPEKNEMLWRYFRDQDVTLSRIGDGRIREIATGMGLRSFAFTPGGKRILLSGSLNDHEHHLKMVQRTTGRTLETRLIDNGSCLRVHPLSGELLIFGAQNVALPTGSRQPWITFDDAGGTLWQFQFLGGDNRFLGPVTSPGALREFKSFEQKNSRVTYVWSLDADRDSIAAEPTSPEKFGANFYRGIYASGDGERFAAFSWADTVAIYERDQEGAKYVFRTGGKLTEKPVPRRLSFDKAVQRFWSNDGIWDANTRKLIRRLELPEGWQIEDTIWLPDGSRLIGLAKQQSPGDGEAFSWRAYGWDSATGSILKSADLPCAMNMLKLSANAKRVALAGQDKAVHFLDAESLELQGRLRAHNDEILQLDWHPSLPILATTSSDLAVKLWNLEKETLLETIWAPEDKPQGLQFSPSGKLLVCHDNNSKLYVFDVRDYLGVPKGELRVARTGGHKSVKSDSVPPPIHESLRPARIYSTGEWIFPRDSGLPLREFNGFKEISRDADYRIQDMNSFRQHNQAAEQLLGGRVPDNTDFLFHSREQMSSPHIVIRLKSASQIRALRVLNRSTPNLQARAKNLTLWLSNDEKSWRQVWQAKSAQPEWLIDLPNNPRARYLKLGLPNTGTLHLKELVVFGKRM